MDVEKNMEENTEKKSFRDGVKVGIGLMVPVCILVSGIVVLLMVTTGILRPASQSYSVGKDTLSERIAEISAYIDKYFVFDVDETQMEEYALKGYVTGLSDVYSGYFTAEEYQEKLTSSNGSFVGIGVSVQQDSESGALRIWNVYADSPAGQAGMQENDVIVGVNGESVIGWTLSDVVALIRGEEGTEVLVQVQRGDQLLDLAMVRSRVDKQTVSYELLTDQIGYITLIEFDTVSVEQMRAAIASLQEQGMKKLILDLRGNPGGALNSVLGIADLFLPETNIFYSQNKAGERTDYNATAEQLCTEEMVILVNGGSASAAEVLSGSLQDHGRAKLVGLQTYGKGIIQSFYELSDGSALKLTVAHYFTPNGTDIHGVGITPDVVLEDDPDTLDVDEQMQKAMELLQ